MYLLGPSERAGTLLAFWWLCLNWPGPADTHWTSKLKAAPLPLDWRLCLLKPAGPVARHEEHGVWMGFWLCPLLLTMAPDPQRGGPRGSFTLTFLFAFLKNN